MPPYNTRSAARKRVPGPYENAIVSPSANGTGTHIRRTYPSPEEVPTLSNSGSAESKASSHRPVAPYRGEGEDKDEESQRPLPARSTKIANKRKAAIVVEERAARMRAQPLPDQENDSGDERATNPKGQKLPPGIIGLGRQGTWIVGDARRPTPSTDQRPSVREFGKEQEMQDQTAQGLPLTGATQKDLGGNPRSGRLTPLPSFVTGYETVQKG